MKKALFWLKLSWLVIKYGIQLVEWLLDRYDKVEGEAEKVVMTSDDKAEAFNRGAFNDFQAVRNTLMTVDELNRVRERIWKAKNPGKTPKPLTKRKLRVGKARV